MKEIEFERRFSGFNDPRPSFFFTNAEPDEFARFWDRNFVFGDILRWGPLVILLSRPQNFVGGFVLCWDALRYIGLGSAKEKIWENAGCWKA